MSKIKVGEYVRCKNGVIAKITEITYNLMFFDKEIYWKNVMPIYELEKPYLDFIVKHSFNIIDLIEEGDMLNKNEVIEVKGVGLCIYDINNKNWLPIGNIDYQMGIELAIVTHEQMKGMEYKV